MSIDMSSNTRPSGADSRNRKLVANTIIISFGQFFPKIITFVTLPVLTGYLSTEEYGIYDLVITMVSLLLPAVTLQISSAVFRFLIDERNNERAIRATLSTSFCFVILVSAVVLSVYWFISNTESLVLKILICSYYFIDILVVHSLQCARGLGYNSKYSIAAMICSICQLVFVLVFVLFARMSLVGAVAALLLSDLIELCFLLLSTNIVSYLRVSSVDRAKLAELISYSWPMVPNSLSMWIMRLSNRIVITAFMGVAANAIFAVAYKIPQILNLAQGSFMLAWQESASITSHDSDVAQYYSNTFKLVYRFSAGVMALIIAFSPFLFSILIQGEYEEAYIHIPILLFGMFFYSLATYLGGIYVAFKKTKAVGISTMAAAALNLVIDIVGIGYIGLFAASGAMLISFIALSVFRMIDIKRIVAIDYPFKDLALVVTLLAILCAISIIGGRLSIIINFVLGVLLFFILNWRVIKKLVCATAGAIRKKLSK